MLALNVLGFHQETILQAGQRALSECGPEGRLTRCPLVHSYNCLDVLQLRKNGVATQLVTSADQGHVEGLELQGADVLA